MNMARKQVLVQLDDALVARLDKLAKQLRTNRSDLLRRGAQAVLEAHALVEADERLVEAYREQPQEPAIVAAAVRLASQVGAPW